MNGDGWTNWRALLAEEMSQNGEAPADILSSSATDTELDAPLYDSYGAIHYDGAVQPERVNVWTAKSVYIGQSDDGQCSVRRVARHPEFHVAKEVA